MCRPFTSREPAEADVCAGAGVPEVPDLSKYFRPVSTIRSGSQSSSHSGHSSHAFDADAHGVASTPVTLRGQTLSPFDAPEFPLNLFLETYRFICFFTGLLCFIVNFIFWCF